MQNVKSVIYISDTHCGCRLAICGKEKIQLDDGGFYEPSPIQIKLHNYWETFWGDWIPRVTRGQPFAVVHNGDIIDGVHHNSTTQITHNLTDQKRIAYKLLKPIVELCEGRYYQIRGTEAHVGKSASEEEELAEQLGAIPNKEGQYARWDLWKMVGENTLVHSLHHIGTTGSAAHEASAVNAELSAEYVEAARWNQRPPDYVVRSHRHRYIAVQLNAAKGYSASIVTPCWQAKTPFTWKIPGARVSVPQFGGIAIVEGDEEHYYRAWVQTVERSKVE